MQEIFQWLRNLAGYLVFLSVLEQMIPGKDYGKYIRFFAGLVLILLVISPWTDRAGISGQMARAFQELEFQDEAKELKEEILGAEKERLNRLIRQYESAIALDIAGTAREKGYEVTECRVTIAEDESEEDFGRVTGVLLSIDTDAGGKEEDVNLLRKRISSDYNLEESNVDIQVAGRER